MKRPPSIPYKEISNLSDISLGTFSKLAYTSIIINLRKIHRPIARLVNNYTPYTVSNFTLSTILSAGISSLEEIL